MKKLLFSLLLWTSVLHSMAQEHCTQVQHLTRQNGLTGNQVTALVQDPYGYIWAGTTSGLNRISGYEVYTWDDHEHPLHRIHVSAMETDKTNNCLWIFTPQGLVGCIDLTHNQLIPHSPDKADSLLSFHHKGKLYMWQYGPTRRCIRTRLNKGRLTSESFKKEVSCIHTDEAGNDWILTTRGLYLNGFEEKLPASDSVTHIALYRNICLALTPNGMIAYNHSRRIVRRTPFPTGYQSAAQCTGMTTWGDRLLVVTPSKVFTYHILDGTFAAPANLQLKEGRILTGSDRYIYAYDGRGKLLRLDEEGNVSPIQLMSAEAARPLDGQLPQVATVNATTEAFVIRGNGLHLHDTETGKLHHYRQGEAHGLIPDNQTHSPLADHNGCLWIATGQAGIVCLSVNRREETSATLTKQNAPVPHINMVTVDGEEHLINSDEMGLSYTHNNIEWHYSCMAYDQLEEIQYQYFLEGRDSTWQAPTQSHKATYKELPPGLYRFHVRASADGANWSQESTHTITIGKPWWNRWPAYAAILIVLTIVGTLLYLVMRKPAHAKGQATAPDVPNRGEEAPLHAENPPTKAEEAPSTDDSPIEKGGEESETTGLTAKEARFKQHIEEMMAAHVEDSDFTVEAFAEQMKLKRTQFYTKVKRVTGLSPIEFLRKGRLEHAARLLMETDMNIDEVRERCGFSNSTTFYNYFKQHFGMTPRQYRNRKSH